MSETRALNLFQEKTLEALNIHPDDERLSSGFDIDCQDDKEQDCALIMGINPAGKENDARREKNGLKPYFYSLIGKTNGNMKGYLSNTYFRPICNLVNAATGDGAKWQWCSKEEREIIEQINENEDLFRNKKTVIKQYEKDHGKPWVIYVGDMFYYHETSSKKLLDKLKDIDCHTYSEEMLKLHIDALKRHNKNIRFVYINNAKVSQWLKEDGESAPTHIVVDGVVVFLGAMLSGKRAMDVFSRERLIKEISKYLNDKSACF